MHSVSVCFISSMAFFFFLPLWTFAVFLSLSPTLASALDQYAPSFDPYTPGPDYICSWSRGSSEWVPITTNVNRLKKQELTSNRPESWAIASITTKGVGIVKVSGYYYRAEARAKAC